MVSIIPFCTFLFLTNLPLFQAYPVKDDLDILNALLQQLEGSSPRQKDVPVPHAHQSADDADETLLTSLDITDDPRAAASQADMIRLLSAQDLKAVRSNAKKYSGCFGRKLNRIGSMSLLGCNTVSQSNKTRK